jgi:hypothetical protein
MKREVVCVLATATVFGTGAIGFLLHRHIHGELERSERVADLPYDVWLQKVRRPTAAPGPTEPAQIIIPGAQDCEIHVVIPGVLDQRIKAPRARAVPCAASLGFQAPSGQLRIELAIKTRGAWQFHSADVDLVHGRYLALRLAAPPFMEVVQRRTAIQLD